MEQIEDSGDCNRGGTDNNDDVLVVDPKLKDELHKNLQPPTLTPRTTDSDKVRSSISANSVSPLSSPGGCNEHEDEEYFGDGAFNPPRDAVKQGNSATKLLEKFDALVEQQYGQTPMTERTEEYLPEPDWGTDYEDEILFSSSPYTSPYGSDGDGSASGSGVGYSDVDRDDVSGNDHDDIFFDEDSADQMAITAHHQQQQLEQLGKQLELERHKREAVEQDVQLLGAISRQLEFDYYLSIKQQEENWRQTDELQRETIKHLSNHIVRLEELLNEKEERQDAELQQQISEEHEEEQRYEEHQLSQDRDHQQGCQQDQLNLLAPLAISVRQQQHPLQQQKERKSEQLKPGVPIPKSSQDQSASSGSILLFPVDSDSALSSRKGAEPQNSAASMPMSSRDRSESSGSILLFPVDSDSTFSSRKGSRQLKLISSMPISSQYQSESTVSVLMFPDLVESMLLASSQHKSESTASPILFPVDTDSSQSSFKRSDRHKQYAGVVEEVAQCHDILEETMQSEAIKEPGTELPYDHYEGNCIDAIMSRLCCSWYNNNKDVGEEEN